MSNQGRRHGGAGGGSCPLKVSRKEKNENMGYFHALKLAFLSSLIRKYMLWEGFYHDFSTKKVSAFAPWPPPRGSPPGPPPGGAAPWTPELTSPPLKVYPGAAPVSNNWKHTPRFHIEGVSKIYKIEIFLHLFVVRPQRLQEACFPPGNWAQIISMWKKCNFHINSCRQELI